MSSLRLETMKIMAADLGEESPLPDLLGEHILQNQLEFCLGEKDEIYEAYGRRKTAYPYRQLNQYTRELKEKEISIAVLENRHLKAVFLTEYGGRLWELWDKATNQNLLYTNDILRFSNLALRNAWFSGGVEWNIGIIGHTAYTTMPLYMATLETENGIPILRMYEYERVRKVFYQMDFWLEEEDTRLNCRMRIVNENTEVIPMYWWSNIAVPEYENGRVIVPADKAYTNMDNKVYKVDIPLVNGVDVLDYQKIPYSVDYFFEIADDKPKYITNVNSEGYGLLHTSTARLRGRKLFSWGNSRGSNHWQEFLTEKAGRYLEIQAGLGKTQYGCIPMAPHTAWEWLEQYGPISLEGNISEEIHEKRQGLVLEYLEKHDILRQMEERLHQGQAWVQKEAQKLADGSGYGALVKERKMSCHLKFVNHSLSLKKWQSFWETGILHQPPINEKPDEFLMDEGNLDFLIQTLDSSNQNNWYAFYQAGVACYTLEQYRQAEEYLKRSLKIAENAWAAHALACVYLVMGKQVAAKDFILQGLEIECQNTSYLKEAFKILNYCKAFSEMKSWYESFDSERQAIGKLKFYYIFALQELEETERAAELLQEQGGLIIDDVREGEDSMGELWRVIQKKLKTEKTELPFCFDFKSN